MLKNILGITVSAAALGLFVIIVDWNAACLALAGLDYFYLLLSLLFMALPYLFRLLRWRLLLLPLAVLPLRPIFSAMCIGFLANNLLPAHLGELVRAYLLGRWRQLSASAVLATVVMERIYDGLMLLLMLLGVLLFLPPGPERAGDLSLTVIHSAGLAGAVLFGGLMILMQLLRSRWHKMEPRLRRLTSFLSPSRQDSLIALLDSFAQGLAMGGWRQLGGIGLYSLLVWISFALSAWCLFAAFSLELGLMAAFLLEAVVALSLLIPAAPAYVGTFQLAAMFTLGYLGADTGAAGSYALLLWLISFVVSTGFGLLALSLEGVTLKDLTKIEK
ncbi:MAG: flippase-like domain-containing protein [Desulfarculales bacterium]|jgi:uncharacterized protein (TIRG00374 family)|nr:flippase-like domain-containing protein [Desulfarculales bacterium]